MTTRIKVETYRIGADKTATPEKMSPPPVRSVRGKQGSSAVKKAARDAHVALGYKVRSISFTETGILVYVDDNQSKPFASARSGPREAARTRRPRRRK